MTAARQLPLDLGHVPALTRDDLVVTPANEHAMALIDAWPDWSTPVAVLAGPAGAGKSHLGAIWKEQARAVELVPGDIERHVAAIGARPVLIDNIEPGLADERGLFHLINAVRSAGSSLLLLSRAFPSAWQVELPDLASRMKAATVVEIHEPDDMLLSGVIMKLFADRQVEVEPHVVQFIVRRIERSVATAIGVVERLDRLALEQKSRITRAMASTAIDASEEGQRILDL